MARYFFHIRNESVLTEDLEGSDLIDDAAAITEARTMAREFAIDDLTQCQAVANRLIEIIDLAGRYVGTLRARDILGKADPVPEIA